MGGILFGLAGLAGLGSFVCFVMVLIKMFQNEGALKGILGLICSIYAFIWGWMNADKLGIKNVMLGWTACIVLQILGGVGGAMMGGAGN